MRIRIEASDHVGAKDTPWLGHSFQEALLFYNGKNRKRAINWGLKKAQSLWPNYRHHSATIVEPSCTFASTVVIPYNPMLED